MSFDHAVARVLGHEGGYSDDPADPGNWTGGRVGAGALKGTKSASRRQAIPISTSGI